MIFKYLFRNYGLSDIRLIFFVYATLNISIWRITERKIMAILMVVRLSISHNNEACNAKNNSRELFISFFVHANIYTIHIQNNESVTYQTTFDGWLYWPVHCFFFSFFVFVWMYYLTLESKGWFFCFAD